MDETVIVIMLKNKETGFLEKEFDTLDIDENIEYIVNIFAIEDDDIIKLHIKLSTDRDVKDWEYSAIYDYYDIEIYNDVAEVIDANDDYNPVWEFIIPYDDSALVKEKINMLLRLHKNEIEEVYNTIIDKESIYDKE